MEEGPWGRVKTVTGPLLGHGGGQTIMTSSKKRNTTKQTKKRCRSFFLTVPAVVQSGQPLWRSETGGGSVCGLARDDHLLCPCEANHTPGAQEKTRHQTEAGIQHVPAGGSKSKNEGKLAVAAHLVGRVQS